MSDEQSTLKKYGIFSNDVFVYSEPDKRNHLRYYVVKLI